MASGRSETATRPSRNSYSFTLANIVLNQLDWRLDAAGFRFVRYADDFVVVTKTKAQAEEARTLVEQVLTGLGLQLNPEKTHITTYGKGYDFLGFTMSSRSRRMRTKSKKKLKDRIRELTPRKHNLDARVIEKLNPVIRGTANYFATDFSTGRWELRKLDSWIRMRLRCMKTKRKSHNDNRRIRDAHFRDKLGLLSLEDFCVHMSKSAR